MSQLRVLFNVPEFGIFKLLGGHRAGIGRLVEELARALLAEPNCDLRLMATDFQGLTADYVRAHFPESALLAHAAWQLGISRAASTQLYHPRLMYDTELARRWPVIRLARLGAKALMAPLRPLLRRVPAQEIRLADVFHTAGGSLIPAQVRARENLPVFVTVCDLIKLRHPEFFPGHATNREKARLLKTFSKRRWYICISESTRTDLLSTGRCDPEKVSVAPLAAGEAFRPFTDSPEAASAVRERYGVRANAPYFMSLCTLEPRKNIESVVRTFLRLVREERGALPDDLQLVLVGAAGWKYGPVHELAAAGGQELARRIVFTGFVPDEDLSAFLSFTTGFFYLSFFEGFGLPPLEAMACGAPVVVSNVSSLPEVVGDAGILLAPRDEDGICQAMLRLVRDASHRADLSRRSLKRAALFSWKRCAEQNLKAYRRAL